MKLSPKQLISDRKSDLKKLLHLYLQDVRDPSTGLIKKDAHLSSARDGSLRKSSFYDNVILWKTLELADKLGIQPIAKNDLSTLRTKIIELFWLPADGHFKDDLGAKPADQNYSSDWLIALPTGFLSVTEADDMAYVQQSVEFIKQHKIDQPLPIKYTASSDHVEAPWAVKTFVPNYGGDAIWSYWGAEYISLLAQLHKQTGQDTYKTDAKAHAATYYQKIEQTRGFPETFDAQGNFLQTPVYKSIRQTGWVVQFEHALWLLEDKK